MDSAAAGPSSKVRVGSSQSSESSLKRKRGLFQKELHCMMYGYGDDRNPLPETEALVEDIVVEYVTDWASSQSSKFGIPKRGKLMTEDFLFLIRKDLPKHNRGTELLSMKKNIDKAKKMLSIDEEILASAAD